jgi:hypothetical protein
VLLGEVNAPEYNKRKENERKKEQINKTEIWKKTGRKYEEENREMR